MRKHGRRPEVVKAPHGDPPANAQASQPASPAEGAPPAAPVTQPRWLGLAAVGVFLAVFAAMAATAGDLGLTWDEPAYLHSAVGNIEPAGESSTDRSPAPDRHAHCGMLKWFDKLLRAPDWAAASAAFSQRAILEAWDYNRYGPDFHPPLSGMLASLGYAAAGRWMGPIAAWRVRERRLSKLERRIGRESRTTRALLMRAASQRFFACTKAIFCKAVSSSDRRCANSATWPARAALCS